MLVTLALQVLTPIIVGFLTPFVLDAVKRANATLDASPSYVKQGAAVLIASVATTASTILETGPLPTDLAQWDRNVVQALVAGFLAIAIKQHKQLKKAQERAHG